MRLHKMVDNASEVLRELLAEAGATAIIQPGGSVRDDEVTKAADEHKLAMIITKMRHFRH